MRFFILLVLIGMTGCATAPPPPLAALASAEPATAATPSRPHLWSKLGGSNEDFQRTKAACMVRQIEAQNINPNSWNTMGLFALCMRANGWVMT